MDNSVSTSESRGSQAVMHGVGGHDDENKDEAAAKERGQRNKDTKMSTYVNRTWS